MGNLQFFIYIFFFSISLCYGNQTSDVVNEQPVLDDKSQTAKDTPDVYSSDEVTYVVNDDKSQIAKDPADVYSSDAPEECSTVLDVGFILDSSASVKHFYQNEKNFLKVLSRVFNIKKGGTHVGVITFSLKAEISIKLNQFYNQRSFEAAVNRIPFMQSVTRIDSALALAYKSFFKKSNGGRRNVPKLLVLLTDGAQTVMPGSSSPAKVAKVIRDAGINILVIGITNFVDRYELAGIAGGAGKYHLVRSWNLLRNRRFLKKMGETICKAGLGLSGVQSFPSMPLINGRWVIKRGRLVNTLSTIPAQYVISFSLRPTAFSSGWSNVLHFTTGANRGRLGTRIPGVWLTYNRLYICGSVKGDANFCYHKRIAKNRWTDIKIVNSKVGSKYWYAVYVNNVQIGRSVNPSSRVYKNVKVYITDPWYKSFRGSLRNIKLAAPGLGLSGIPSFPSILLRSGRWVIKRGRLMTTLSAIPVQYVISFSLRPTAFSSGWSNVLHFTTGANRGKLGTRIPGVWLNYNKLYICGSVKGNANFCYYAIIAKNRWTNVQIVNSKVGSKYWYAVYVNGETLGKMVNPSSRVYKNVKVYTTDPWYKSFRGSLRNIKLAAPGLGLSGLSSFQSMPLIDRNFVIKKNNLMTTLSAIPAQYVISFSIRPTVFSRGWSNVLHFTTGANRGKRGTRIPGVWLYYNKLHICSNSNSNRCYNSKPIARNRWTNVYIVNSKIGSNYLYAVYVNGKILGKMVHSSSRGYKNVKVYITDPWYKSFRGSLRNIRIAVPGALPVKIRPKVTCISGADVAFLLDSSGSLSKHYRQEKYFLKQLSAAFRIKMGTSQASVVTFASRAQLSIPFNRYKNQRAFNRAVDRIRFMSGGTRIDRALYKASSVLFNRRYGARRGVAKVLVLLTDGSQSKERGARNPAYVARQLRRRGIKTIVIGIGNRINKRELRNIGGGIAYIARYWKILRSLSFINNLTRKICRKRGSRIPSFPSMTLINGRLRVKKGRRLTTLSAIPAQYVISFSLRPTAFLRGWSNVLHFTTGLNRGRLGTRIPGVFLNWNKLYICGSVKGKYNFCYHKRIAKNRWTDIKVVNSKVGSKYWYAVYVNDVQIGRTVNPSSRVYKKVEVLTADWWYEAFKGSIRNLKVAAPGLGTSVIPPFPSMPIIYRNFVIKKNNLMTTLSSIPAQYVISFSLRPTAYLRGWSNVLHFTTGANRGKFGTRIPGVWLNWNKLYICGSVKGSANYCVNKKITKSRWTDIQIVNSKVGSKYWYTVRVNGKTLRKTSNPSSRVYKNVKVYITDPWYKSFRGSLRNIRIAAPGLGTSVIPPFPSMPIIYRNFVIKKNNLMTTLSSIPAQYVISFSLRPTAYLSGWSNVLHFTTGANRGKLGTRIPGVWLNWNKLYICGSVKGSANYCVNTKITKNRWTDIKIVNSKVGSKYWYTVHVNGKTLRQTSNPSSRVYKNVKVYITDPWYKSFRGSLRNIRIAAPGALLRTIVPKVRCISGADVGFLLDSSGSLKKHYRAEKYFLKRLSAAFGIKKGKSQAGVVTFASRAQLSIPFNRYKNQRDFNRAVDRIRFMGGGTRIDRALYKASSVLFNRRYGARRGVAKVLVLLTDGSQSKVRGARNPAVVARQLRRRGIKTIVIGIGRGINKRKLRRIGGGIVYTARDWNILRSSSFINNLTRKICRRRG